MDGFGGLVAGYSRSGDELLAQHHPSGTLALHADLVGSVRHTSNAQGVVVGTLSYSPFGNKVSGGTLSPFAFAGERRGAQGSFQYHRDRWMASEFGMFLTLDPEQGQLDIGASLARYGYAGGSPVLYVDPTGRFFDLRGLMVATGLLPVLQAITQRAVAFARAASFAATRAAGRVSYFGRIVSQRLGGLFMQRSGNLVIGPYGQASRAVLDKLARNGGPTTTLYTNLTRLPTAGRPLYVTIGRNAQQTAAAARQTGTIFKAEVPTRLIVELERLGLFRPAQINWTGGVQGVEARIASAAAEYIVHFFTAL